MFGHNHLYNRDPVYHPVMLDKKMCLKVLIPLQKLIEQVDGVEHMDAMDLLEPLKSESKLFWNLMTQQDARWSSFFGYYDDNKKEEIYQNFLYFCLTTPSVIEGPDGHRAYTIFLDCFYLSYPQKEPIQRKRSCFDSYSLKHSSPKDEWDDRKKGYYDSLEDESVQSVNGSMNGNESSDDEKYRRSGDIFDKYYESENLGNEKSYLSYDSNLSFPSAVHSQVSDVSQVSSRGSSQVSSKPTASEIVRQKFNRSKNRFNLESSLLNQMIPEQNRHT